MPALKKWRNITTIGRKSVRQYTVWSGMHQRCYANSSQIANPAYKGCTVCEEWYDYDTFYDWMVKHPFHNQRCEKGFWYQLDKDLLVAGNKVYSPEACEFIPKVMNTFIMKNSNSRGDYPIGVSFIFNKYKASVCNPLLPGVRHLGYFNTPEEAFYVYKKHKEDIAKQIAEKYKDEITERAYVALRNYEINITD